MSAAVSTQNAREQLLHGEPHPGNLLNTRRGPLFVDLAMLPWADRVRPRPRSRRSWEAL